MESSPCAHHPEFVVGALTRLAPPCLVHDPTSILLSLLQDDGMPPLLLVNCIHIPTGLNAEAGPGSSSRIFLIGLLHVNPGARVELEGWISAVHLQVHASIGVPELGEESKWSVAGVEGHPAQIAVDDETVVESGFVRAELEGLRCVYRVRRDLA